MPDTERQFLHDLATPLATAIFLADILHDRAWAEAPTLTDNAKKLIESLAQIKEMATRRREFLIKKGVQGGGAE